jgi:glycosyltransferase involved in cell wall biosynthesis
VATSLSVAICTYNRCDSLAETLTSLRALLVPNDVHWEIVVVDNNSKDLTKQVVEEFARTAPTTTRYLFEPTPGLSHARNKAVRETTGELLLFTDDDVILEPDWLQTTIDTFRDYDADCVGGKVLPVWLAPRPTWLGDRLLNVLAMLDYGDQVIELGRNGDDRCLYGANFAFRRAPLNAAGAFNVDLGRKGNFGAGEDKEIQERLRDAGGRVVYEPRSVVGHKVDASRLKKTYFRRWYYSAGRDRARFTRPSGFLLFGIESYLLREFLETAVRLLGNALLMNWTRCFELELHCILYLSVFKHKVVTSMRGQRERDPCTV